MAVPISFGSCIAPAYPLSVRFQVVGTRDVPREGKGPDFPPEFAQSLRYDFCYKVPNWAAVWTRLQGWHRPRDSPAT